MKVDRSRAAVDELVALVRDVTGNLIPPARHAFLEDVASRRAHALGLPGVGEYVETLRKAPAGGDWRNLISLITIKESYFFRAPQQFEGLRRKILPQLLAARTAERSLVIWSAACARGEEPATLAMLLAEEPALARWSWRILATDVDEEALAGARLGLYGQRAVAQVPRPFLEKYFTPRGKLFELSAALREKIDYRQLNLALPPFGLAPGASDVVLLRNVLIYFRRTLQRKVVAHAAQALAPHGVLFLGASETLWQIGGELESLDLGDCFAYRHRTRPADAEEAPLRRRRPAPTPEPAPPRPAGGEMSPRDWGILQSALAPQVDQPAPSSRAEPTPPIAQEWLLKAVDELAANRTEEAGRALSEALVADPSEPSAYALEGFLHDVTGRTDDAMASYRAALYLDPSLFQVRLLLAECLKRQGSRDRAEHHYREVLAVLGSGRGRALAIFEGLPLPDRETAGRRCRQALKGDRP